MQTRKVGWWRLLLVVAGLVIGSVVALWATGALFGAPSKNELLTAEGRVEQCGTSRGSRGSGGFTLQLAGTPIAFTSKSSLVAFRQACEQIKASPGSPIRVSYTPDQTLPLLEQERDAAVLWALEQNGRVLVSFEIASTQHQERRTLLMAAIAAVMVLGTAFGAAVIASKRRKSV